MDHHDASPPWGQHVQKKKKNDGDSDSLEDDEEERNDEINHNIHGGIQIDWPVRSTSIICASIGRYGVIIEDDEEEEEEEEEDDNPDALEPFFFTPRSTAPPSRWEEDNDRNNHDGRATAAVVSKETSASRPLEPFFFTPRSKAPTSSTASSSSSSPLRWEEHVDADNNNNSDTTAVAKGVLEEPSPRHALPDCQEGSVASSSTLSSSDSKRHVCSALEEDPHTRVSLVHQALYRQNDEDDDAPQEHVTR